MVGFDGLKQRYDIGGCAQKAARPSFEDQTCSTKGNVRPKPDLSVSGAGLSASSVRTAFRFANSVSAGEQSIAHCHCQRLIEHANLGQLSAQRNEKGKQPGN